MSIFTVKSTASSESPKILNQSFTIEKDGEVIYENFIKSAAYNLVYRLMSEGDMCILEIEGARDLPRTKQEVGYAIESMTRKLKKSLFLSEQVHFTLLHVDRLKRQIAFAENIGTPDWIESAVSLSERVEVLERQMENMEDFANSLRYSNL